MRKYRNRFFILNYNKKCDFIERNDCDMFYYEITCRYCGKLYKLMEGTKKYQQYKEDRQRKFSCDDCERRIEADSRKYLFNRD